MASSWGHTQLCTASAQAGIFHHTFAKLGMREEAFFRGENAAAKTWLDGAGTLVEDYRITSTSGMHYCGSS